MSSLRKIKNATTVMDTVGAAFAAFAAVIGAVILAVSGGGLEQIGNWFSTHEFSELTGGYEVLGGVFAYGGSLLGVMFGWIILCVGLIILAVFAVPAVHGLVLQKKTEKYLEAGIDAYKKAAKRDSILKLIFNGLPALAFLPDFVGTLDRMEGLIILYFGIICGLEIKALADLKNLGGETPDAPL